MDRKFEIGFILILAIIGALLTFAACRRELPHFNRAKYGSQDMATVPDGATPEDVEKQLRWIARALPRVARSNAIFKSDLHQLLVNDPNLHKHNWTSETSLASSTPIHFSNTVSSTLNSLFPSNNYDSAYFFSFLYEDCLNRTLIRLNYESTDISKMLVACAQFEGTADTITGYYWDTVNNHLDSLPLYEDIAENYYIWVVEADNDCLENDGATTASFKFDPEGHCGNGKCEPFLRESWATDSPFVGFTYCSDCPPRDTSGYTLILKEIQHFKDRNLDAGMESGMDFCDYEYFERYFSSKYDIFFSYAIKEDCVDGPPSAASYIKDAWYINSIVKRTFRDWYIDNNGNETKKWTDLILCRLNVGKEDVIRERWTSGRHHTSGTGASNGNTITIDRVLSFNFFPKSNMIYMDMLEWDQAKGPYSDAEDISNPCGHDESWWFPNYRQAYHLDGPVTPISHPDEMPKHLPYYWGVLDQTRQHSLPFAIIDYWQDGTSLFGPGSKYVDLVTLDRTSGDPPFDDNSLSVNKDAQAKKSEMRIRLVLLKNH